GEPYPNPSFPPLASSPIFTSPPPPPSKLETLSISHLFCLLFISSLPVGDAIRVILCQLRDTSPKFLGFGFCIVFDGEFRLLMCIGVGFVVNCVCLRRKQSEADWLVVF
ncbi:hypothetical protein Droror1_Dr00020782, partial [Drosera rotundifolia]